MTVKLSIAEPFSPADAAKIFWGFMLLHLLCWTLLPLLTDHNAPLDVIEGYAWGREWLIGTHKHPPMQAWWLEILAILTNRAPWAHYLASQLAITTAFWAVWRTGLRITTPTNALLGTLLLEGVVYYNYTSPEFNPNVLQLTFWALIGFSYLKAVQNNRWFDWVLLGLFSAGGIYSKYSTLLLLILLGALLVLHPQSRPRLKQSGPYLALLTAIILIVPHFQWLLDHSFQPLFYASSRTEHALKFWGIIGQPIEFLASQLLALAACLVICVLLTGGKFTVMPAQAGIPFLTLNFNHVFLHVITWAPIGILLFLSLTTGMKLRDMWGSSLWNFIGLWLVINLKHNLNKETIHRFAVGWSVVFCLGILTYGGGQYFGPIWLGEGKRVHFPGRQMSETMNKVWQEKYHKPLKFALGDSWLSGNLAYYSPTETTETRPHIVTNGNFWLSSWATREQVTKSGGILIWCIDHCENFAAAETIPQEYRWRYPKAKLQPPIILNWQTNYYVPKAVIGWAIIPPASP